MTQTQDKRNINPFTADLSHDEAKVGVGSGEVGRVVDPANTLDVELRDRTIEAIPGDALHQTLQRWNSPRINIYRFIAVNFTFMTMGMTDACFGALLPYIERYYDINYITVATLFIAPFPGIMIAALSNNYIHYKVGQRGLAFLGPVCRVIGFVPFAVHPPFAVLPCIFAIAGFGFGLCDSGFNAWVGNMQSANELLGILHGSYSLGAMISPLIATAMVVKADLPWYTFFYLMIAIVTLELSILLSAFWGATGAVYRQHLQYGTRTGNSADKARVTTLEVLKGPLPWFFALFLFAYVGAEVSLGGWMVTFMLRVRNAERFLAGLTVTLFWMGLMLGRIILGFVTGRIGEKLAVAIYILLCLGLQLLYWLVPHFIASVVFVILLGFFLGPLFPAVIVVAAKLLPAEQHVSAIGFASAFAGGGAAVFPFAVGAAAQKHGVQVLQPFVAAMLVFILFVWLVLPGSMRKGGLETAKEKGTKPGADLARQVRGIMKKRETDN